jgi:hypothetical protein
MTQNMLEIMHVVSDTKYLDRILRITYRKGPKPLNESISLHKMDSLHTCNSRENPESLLIGSRSRISGKPMLQSKLQINRVQQGERIE